jgi:hypothetical protein
MKKLLFIVLLFAAPAFAQVSGYPADAEYGNKNMPCTSGATGHWYTQLVANRWFNCTPAGNNLFMNSVMRWSISSSGTVFTTKYGGSTTTEWNAIFNEFTNWGFNSSIWDSLPTGILPSGGSCAGACKPIPMMVQCNCVQYSSKNLSNLATQATPVLAGAFDLNIPNEGIFELVNNSDTNDMFSPYFAQHLNAFMPTAFTYTGVWEFGFTVGNTVSPGPDFDTTDIATGTNTMLPGILVLETPMIQTGTNSSFYLQQTVLYPDPEIYSKDPMGSPPSVCGITHGNECSLYTYLLKRYSTVTALNTAWSSSYSTLGSSGDEYGYPAFTSIIAGSHNAAVAVGTGDGTTTTFTATLPTHVNPYSVQIMSGSTQVGFDCPNLGTRTHQPRTRCSTAAIGHGLIMGTAISGTITYVGGASTLSVTFTTAPATSVLITANLMANGYFWGGTGLLDEDGSNTGWLGADGVCVLNYAGGGESTQGYACRTGNPASFKVTTTAPAVNQTFAADITEITREWYAKYFDVIHTATKTAFPNTLLYSMAALGQSGTPPSMEALQAANLYFDVAMSTIQPINQTDAQLEITYLTKGYTGAWLNELFMAAPRDSAVPGSTAYATQVLRGQAYFQYQAWMQTLPGFDGNFHFIGMATWGAGGDCDTDSGANNWGFKSCGGAATKNAATTDNAYDGLEAVSTSTLCSTVSSAFTCGSEPSPLGSGLRPFGNAITGPGEVQAGNALWFATRQFYGVY